MSALQPAEQVPPSPSQDRAKTLEQRFTVPVILAALAAVPAMFLTSMEGTPAVAGNIVNYLSLAVLTAESAVLFVLAGDRRRWLLQHKSMVAVALATIPAVVLAVGPVQILRLVRFIGALRVLRVRRVIRAGRILRRRAGLTGPWGTAVVVVATVASAAFVASVLTDPTSTSRQVVEQAFARAGIAPVVLAGGLLAGATVVVWRARRGEERSR